MTNTEKNLNHLVDSMVRDWNKVAARGGNLTQVMTRDRAIVGDTVYNEALDLFEGDENN
jgi:hypothetical protein